MWLTAHTCIPININFPSNRKLCSFALVQFLSKLSQGQVLIHESPTNTIVRNQTMLGNNIKYQQPPYTIQNLFQVKRISNIILFAYSINVLVSKYYRKGVHCEERK